MDIKTSYFGRLNYVKARGYVPVAIVRFAPKWYNGAVFNKLAPSKKLLFRKDLNDAQWRREFLKEISYLDQDEVVQELRARFGEKIALICYEKPDEFCHRHIIADWLNAAGYDVEELNFNRSSSYQLSLF